jgi:hypothetical protein
MGDGGQHRRGGGWAGKDRRGGGQHGPEGGHGRERTGWGEARVGARDLRPL